MGLLCRHDRVLWLANMTSAGERQHYVLVLLETLFKHLPEWLPSVFSMTLPVSSIAPAANGDF
ncbi:hypothetical protein MPER_01902 [Moniliophthora perniciosa FA553]|nr:hypothetical protein MPER_01902 [Moniliophthora perniciosa FA553]